jgi:hypothetical protein
VISYVRYDGDVPWKESDEYAEIINLGDAPVNLDENLAALEVELPADLIAELDELFPVPEAIPQV